MEILELLLLISHFIQPLMGTVSPPQSRALFVLTHAVHALRLFVVYPAHTQN